MTWSRESLQNRMPNTSRCTLGIPQLRIAGPAFQLLRTQSRYRQCGPATQSGAIPAQGPQTRCRSFSPFYRAAAWVPNRLGSGSWPRLASSTLLDGELRSLTWMGQGQFHAITVRFTRSHLRLPIGRESTGKDFCVHTQPIARLS